MTDTKYDPVNHPKHYTQYEHEVIELTEQLGFCLGNAVKYILRAPYKGSMLEDLKKAEWYLNRLLGGDGEREYDPWDEELIALAKTYKNPAIDALFSYHELCEAALVSTLARLDRMRSDAEVTCLKAQLAVVTAERDRLREQLNRKPAEPIPPTPIERYTPSYASGSAEGVDYGV